MLLNGAWRSTASAPALGAGGPEFKSRRPDEYFYSLLLCGSRLFLFYLISTPITCARNIQ